MNQEEFNTHLRTAETSPAQEKIVQLVMQNMKVSATELETSHTSWEESDKIYRGYRRLDKKDEESVQKKEPPKVIIPISYALTQTALSFLMSTFFVDQRLFRLRGNGPEDQRVKEAFELDLNYQMSKEKAYVKFYLWLQDAFKYGIGIVEDTWEEEYRSFRTKKQVVTQPNSIVSAFSSMLGMPAQPTVSWQETVEKIKTFEGCALRNVSPYCFYPDPNVPVCDFQKGAFVGHEEETTLPDLQRLEGTVYHGTEHIKSVMGGGLVSQRPHRVGKFSVFKGAGSVANIMGGDLDLKGSALKVKMEFVATGKELKEKYDYDLGPEFPKLEPIKMVAVVANDQKLIKFEPCGYLHNKFSYNVIEYSPDHNNFINPGLCETVYNLQDMMTWFLNSHVQNVRKAIRNRIIGNPELLHVEDITNGKEFIRTRALGGRNIRDAIYSFEVNDVTRSHVGDLNTLNSIMQIVTGINENTLGQYSTGRRSAREAAAVGSAASARLKMHGMIAWTQGFEPLAQKVLANTNQLRTEEYYNGLLGEAVKKYPYSETVLFDPAKIANGFDFVPYEGTMPSDKEREAMHFTQLVEVLLGNPKEMLALTQVDLNKVIEHIFSLRGINNFEDFKLNPEQVNQELRATVVPDMELEQIRQQGNVAPVSMPGDLAAALSQ